MDSLNRVYIRIKPVFYTLIFEIKLQVKKFVILSLATILLLTLNSYIAYILSSFQPLPYSQVDFYMLGYSYFIIIIVLAVSFFFGGIICSEFKNKTGVAVLPLANRYKLLIGKYFANLILVIGITAIHYLTMALFGYNFYGGPLLKTLVYSFGFAVLFILALSSIVTFLSSFMPSIASVSVIMAFYVFIGDSILSSIIMGINSELEPLYSFYYLFSIIGYIFYPEFSTMERINPYTGRWLFPSIEGAFVVLSLIAIIFFILSSLLFKRREF